MSALPSFLCAALPHQLRQQQRVDVVVMAQSDEARRASTAKTIAQLKVKQALKKEDPEARLPPVTAEACSHFFSDVDAALQQNTRVNVQVSTYHAIDHLSLGAD